jgi:hypothetical protein
MFILNRFKNEIEDIIYNYEQKYWPKGYIYHYRKFEAAKKIICKKELLFADYNHCEDSLEVKLGSDKIKELIKNRCKKDSNWSRMIFDMFSKRFPSYTFSFGKEGYDPNLLCWLVDILVSEYIERFSFYTLSFCEDGDDPKLWKEYGDDYKGCVFGFDFKKPELVEPENYGENIRYLLKVIYEKDTNLFEEIINELLNCFTNYLSDFPVNELEESFLVLIVYLLSLTPVLKSDKYTFEKEYRLVMPSTIDHLGKIYPCGFDDKLFRGLNNKKSHYAYPFEEGDLKEIRVGSKSEENYGNTIYALLNF